MSKRELWNVNDLMIVAPVADPGVVKGILIAFTATKTYTFQIRGFIVKQLKLVTLNTPPPCFDLSLTCSKSVCDTVTASGSATDLQFSKLIIPPPRLNLNINMFSKQS